MINHDMLNSPLPVRRSWDLNTQPSACNANALTQCATARYVLQRVFACLRYFANLCNNSYQPLDGSDTRLISQDKDEGKRIVGSACEDEL